MTFSIYNTFEILEMTFLRSSMQRKDIREHTDDHYVT